MKKILIIEDDRNCFLSYKKIFTDIGYSVLPDNFEQMSNAINPYEKGNIGDFVIQQINENFNDIRMVLCDIKLRNDFRGGNKVVKIIRNYKELSPLYLSMLPIIAITDYADRQKDIVSDGADFSIEKERILKEPDIIFSIIETQIDKFEKNIKMLNIFKDNKKVFIVHGHAGAEEKVARFLRQLNLQPIILREQTNEGATIIEKIEKNTDVGYAIILYTSCDKGKEKTEDDSKMKPRARQNVVFEHGYLTSKLGRNNVCILLEKDIEIPGDINGLLYIPFDDLGAWKTEVAKNMKKRGLLVDLNLL